MAQEASWWELRTRNTIAGNLEKDILFSKAPGKRGRGRSPTRWSDIIKVRIGSVVNAVVQTRDRDRWRILLGAIWL